MPRSPLFHGLFGRLRRKRSPRAGALAVAGLNPGPNRSASVGLAPGTRRPISSFSGVTPTSAKASRYSLNSVVKATRVCEGDPRQRLAVLLDAPLTVLVL